RKRCEPAERLPGGPCDSQEPRCVAGARDIGGAITTLERSPDRETCGSRPQGEQFMEYLIGAGLAVVVCAFAALVKLDRDGAFYPTMAIVVATYYILFAVMANSMQALALECLMAAAFFGVAVAGFKKGLWLAVIALAGHGVFDFFHHRF